MREIGLKGTHPLFVADVPAAGDVPRREPAGVAGLAQPVGALVTDGTGVYYMGDDGAMQTGLVEIAGNKFYFDPSTGGMLTNTTVTVGKQTYMIDVSGICTDVSEMLKALPGLPAVPAQ